MVIYAVKVKAAKDISLEEARQAVDYWKNNHEEVLTVQSSSLSVSNTEIDGSGTDYFVGSWRFSNSEDKKALLDEIASSLEQAVSWYQIDYHECDHDENQENRSGCPSWSPDREHGNIPEGV